PPAAPRVVIGPAPTGRGKHIATEDPRAEIFRASLGKAVVDAGRADARIAEHALERARRKEPLVKLLATFTERVLFALIRSRTIAVQRNSETIHAQFTHGDLRSTRGSIVRRTSCTRIDERRNPFDPGEQCAARPRGATAPSHFDFELVANIFRLRFEIERWQRCDRRVTVGAWMKRLCLSFSSSFVLFSMLVSGLAACGSDTATPSGSGGSSAGTPGVAGKPGTGGSAPTSGGSSSGGSGSVSGGSPSGGTGPATGGSATGGSATGGSATGGSATGGSATGG